MRIPKFKKPNLKIILLYYSVVLSTFLMVGGIVMAFRTDSKRDIITSLLFLPLVLFLWLTLIQKVREGRTKKIEKKRKTKEKQILIQKKRKSKNHG